MPSRLTSSFLCTHTRARTYIGIHKHPLGRCLPSPPPLPLTLSSPFPLETCVYEDKLASRGSAFMHLDCLSCPRGLLATSKPIMPEGGPRLHSWESHPSFIPFSLHSFTRFSARIIVLHFFLGLITLVPLGFVLAIVFL